MTSRPGGGGSPGRSTPIPGPPVACRSRERGRPRIDWSEPEYGVEPRPRCLLGASLTTHQFGFVLFEVSLMTPVLGVGRPNDELDERRLLIRQVRQRLESLRRAGVGAFPRSSFRGTTVVAPPSRPGAGAGRRSDGADPDGDRAGDSTAAAGPSLAPPWPNAAVPPTVVAVGRPGRMRPSRRRRSARCSRIRDSRRPPYRPRSGRPCWPPRRPRSRVASRCPHLASDADPDRLRLRHADRPADVHRRGAGGRRGPDRPAVRRPRRAAPHRHDHQGHGPEARGRLHRQYPQVPPAREPHAHARGGRQLLVVSRAPDRRHPARNSSACWARRPPSACWASTPTTSLGPLRRQWHRYRGIKTLVTYHPSYLLRNPAAKKDAWEDLQLLMKEMGLSVPGRKRGSGE